MLDAARQIWPWRSCRVGGSAPRHRRPDAVVSACPRAPSARRVKDARGYRRVRQRARITNRPAPPPRHGLAALASARMIALALSPRVKGRIRPAGRRFSGQGRGHAPRDERRGHSARSGSHDRHPVARPRPPRAEPAANRPACDRQPDEIEPVAPRCARVARKRRPVCAARVTPAERFRHASSALFSVSPRTPPCRVAPRPSVTSGAGSHRLAELQHPPIVQLPTKGWHKLRPRPPARKQRQSSAVSPVSLAHLQRPPAGAADRLVRGAWRPLRSGLARRLHGEWSTGRATRPRKLES